jgi:hypothetical protein
VTDGSALERDDLAAELAAAARVEVEILRKPVAAEPAADVLVDPHHQRMLV